MPSPNEDHEYTNVAARQFLQEEAVSGCARPALEDAGLCNEALEGAGLGLICNGSEPDVVPVCEDHMPGQTRPYIRARR